MIHWSVSVPSNLSCCWSGLVRAWACGWLDRHKVKLLNVSSGLTSTTACAPGGHSDRAAIVSGGKHVEDWGPRSETCRDSETAMLDVSQPSYLRR